MTDKSDIMKAAEEAADKLELLNSWRKLSVEEGSPLNQQQHHEINMALRWLDMNKEKTASALIAAAELLKQVEVLPAGSEPEVGDFVMYSNLEALPISIQTDEYGNHYYAGRHYLGDKYDHQVQNLQIIQRNGKPVIFEKEGV